MKMKLAPLIPEENPARQEGIIPKAMGQERYLLCFLKMWATGFVWWYLMTFNKSIISVPACGFSAFGGRTCTGWAEAPRYRYPSLPLPAIFRSKYLKQSFHFPKQR